MVTMITEHINYAIDTLERCRHQKDHLNNLYDNIILRQRADLGNIKHREESLNSRISELEAETLSLNKKIHDIEICCETKLKQVIKLTTKNNSRLGTIRQDSCFFQKDTELGNVVAQCQVVQKQLERAIEEKEEISRTMSIRENRSFDFEKKISVYEYDEHFSL